MHHPLKNCYNSTCTGLQYWSIPTCERFFSYKTLQLH